MISIFRKNESDSKDPASQNEVNPLSSDPAAAKRHPLEMVLQMLDGEAVDAKKVRKVVKDAIFKDALGNDPSTHPLSRLLTLALSQCVKPVLLGNLERQAMVDRIVRLIQAGDALENVEDHTNWLLEVAGWIRESLDQKRQSAMATAGELVLPFLHAIHVLTQNMKGVDEEAEKLIKEFEQPLSPKMVERLSLFSQKVREHGEGVMLSFEREREEFRQLVAELARNLRDMLESSGTFNDSLDDTLTRLQKSDSLEDMGRMREILLAETNALKQHTEEITRRLMENEMRLMDTERKMRAMEDMLAKSRSESLTDILTGAANRRAFNLQMEREVARATRHGLALSLILFDLDHFKKVNDTYGHPIGDKVLANVANRVRGLIRESDFFARYGGEEFALILPETDITSAIQVAEKIRNDMARLRFRIQEEQLSVTLSLGVSQFRAGMSVQALIQGADTSLYAAKRNGRNRVEFGRSNAGG